MKTYITKRKIMGQRRILTSKNQNKTGEEESREKIY